MSKTGYNFIDLFSGCGGFSHGLEMAGHKCLLGVDHDKFAVESFSENHPSAVGVCMDIHKLTKTKLEKIIDVGSVDMVVGGPPCQGFSTVGKGNSDDLRNSLFKQFIRIVKITSPKIIIFENVTGILAKKNEEVLKNIFKSFEKLGYQMDAQVMSADEFGVPSRRKRTILMGVKGGNPAFPEAVFGKRKKFITVKKALKSLATKNGTIHNHEVERAQISNQIDRERLKYIPAGSGIRYEKDEKSYLPKKLFYGINWKEISEGRFRQTRLQRLPEDAPAPTILTSRTMYYHPVETRYLTPREAAKCQSFSNDFIFKGSLTAQFRQIGNAVPPLMAKHIGEEIKGIKFNIRKLKKIDIAQTVEIGKKAFNYKVKKRA